MDASSPSELWCRAAVLQISNEKHLDLLSGDQCIREMAKGTIFHGLAEGPIRFLPTYKFEKGCESNEKQHFYDQGDKKRVPAWTDRVLFRGSGAQRSALECNAEEQRTGVRVSARPCTWLLRFMFIITLVGVCMSRHELKKYPGVMVECVRQVCRFCHGKRHADTVLHFMHTQRMLLCLLPMLRPLLAPGVSAQP